MKKIVHWLLTFALVFGMLPLYAQETRAETIPFLNGGFDSGLTGWSRLFGDIANMTVTSEIKYSGGFSLKIKDMENDNSYAMISDKYPVSEGKTYTASAKLYLAGGSGAIYLYFFDAAGTRIHSASQAKSSPQSTWTDVTVTSPAPAGAVSVSVVLATSIVNVGTAYFDDITLKSATLLANGGFEEGMTGWNLAYGSQQQITVSADTAFSGMHSLKIVDNTSSGSFGMMSDPFPVTPGKQYTAEVQVQTANSGSGAIYLRFFDAANNQIDQVSVGGSSAAGSWRNLSVKMIAPDNAVTGAVLLYSGVATMGTAYFDEVTISEVSLVRGTVKEGDGTPVRWANAYLYHASDTALANALSKAETDQNGAFAFSRSVEDGQYVVRVSKDGYLTNTVSVSVGSSGSGNANVTLTRDPNAALYTVSGKVRTSAGDAPIAGANVALYDDSDTGYTQPLGAAVSGADGTFTISEQVPNGRYMARAVKAGYYTASFPVSVQGRDFTTIDIRMPVKESVTEQNMPKPPAVHPRLYVTPDLIPELQAKIQTPEFQPVWDRVQTLSYIPSYTGKSSGTTLDFENYAFPAPENARYVKIYGRGNSTNQWNSITETEIFTRNSAGEKEKLSIAGAQWSSQDRQYDGNNTIDGDLNEESRWSAEGTQEWIEYDLGAVHTVTDVAIAWYQGNIRKAYFDIYVSADGQNWKLIDLGMGDEPGLLPPPPEGQTNYSASLKNAVEYNAMKYLLTGDEESGRLAIRTILNFMDTAVYAGLDTFRPIGETIHAASVTYDWTYPLLTEQEKTRFITSMKRLAGEMSMGYPPTRGGSITGHSGETMLMKDLLAAGIAVYDEDPEIYNVSAIRFFNEFVPARNFWYQSGMHHQGDSYGFGVRLMPELWAQWMFARMGYPDVFSREQREVLYRGFYLRRPDGQLMRDGDTSWQNSNPPGYYWRYSSPIALLAASYYKDPYLQGEFLRQHTLGSNPFVEILFADMDIPVKPVDDLPLTRYFGFPYGTMIARTGWNMDSPNGRASDVVAEMKIGNYQYGNHQHLDMGSFQIYYKGALAIDSGMYQGKHGAYGSEHDKHYYKRTIAHNSMLVYDPAEDFYSDWANDGGQVKLPEAVSLDDLLGKNYYNAQVEGYQFGPDAHTPDFSYIKGDLTAAYSDKVDQFKRSFVFLNLKDSSVPAAMVVFDKVESSDPHFRKYWLLHSMEEPQVSGNTTTISRTEDGYGGKLVNETLLPAAGNTVIEKIGGPGREFEVFGTNYIQEPAREPGQHTVEGGKWRVQISPQNPAETDYFLNVMQVMDSGSSAKYDVKAVDSELMTGAIIADYAVLFSKSGWREDGSIQLNINDSQDELKFVIADLAAGTWRIQGNGIDRLAEVTEEGGVLHFSGAPGAYVLTYISEQDQVPPVTIAHIDGLSGEGTFNRENVTVSFSTYDGLSGVERTEYRLNGGAWNAVDGAVELTDEGVHLFEYRSLDKAGNAEEPKQALIAIDKTAPVLSLNGGSEIALFAGGVFADPGATAADALDKGVGERIAVEGSVEPAVPGTYTLVYRVSDLAGNEAEPAARTVYVLDAGSVAKLDFDSNSYILSSGDSVQATVTASVYGDSRNYNVTQAVDFHSSHPEAIAVSSEGVITATGVGAAVITASHESLTAWAVVSAGSAQEREFAAAELMLDHYAALGELAHPLHSQLANKLESAKHFWSMGRYQQSIKMLDDMLDALGKHSDKVTSPAAQAIGEAITAIKEAFADSSS